VLYADKRLLLFGLLTPRLFLRRDVDVMLTFAFGVFDIKFLATIELINYYPGGGLGIELIVN